MNRFEIAEDLRNKPVDQLIKFKSHRCYYADGYKLSHHGIWKLTFQNKSIMSEKDPQFWEIVSMYNFRPPEDIDTIGDDSRPSDWQPPEQDTNFTPSIGRDQGFMEVHERPFPIWEWNEYVSTFDLYKVG